MEGARRRACLRVVLGTILSVCASLVPRRARGPPGTTGTLQDELRIVGTRAGRWSRRRVVRVSRQDTGQASFKRKFRSAPALRGRLEGSRAFGDSFALPDKGPMSEGQGSRPCRVVGCGSSRRGQDGRDPLRALSASITGALSAGSLQLDAEAVLGATSAPAAGGPTLSVYGAAAVLQGAAGAPRLDVGAESAPGELTVVGAAMLARDASGGAEDATSGSLLVERRVAVGDYGKGMPGEVDVQGDVRLDSFGGLQRSSLVVPGLARSDGLASTRPLFGGLRTIFHDERAGDASSYLDARTPAEWAAVPLGIYSETKRADAANFALPGVPAEAMVVLTTYVDAESPANLFQEARCSAGFFVRAATVAAVAWGPWAVVAAYPPPPTPR